MLLGGAGEAQDLPERSAFSGAICRRRDDCVAYPDYGNRTSNPAINAADHGHNPRRDLLAVPPAAKISLQLLS